MYKEEIEQAIESVSFGALLNHLRARVRYVEAGTPGEHNADHIVVEFQVPQRDNIAKWSYLKQAFYPVYCNSADELIENVRMHLKNLLAHELDESLLINGNRVFDPHLGAETYGKPE